MFNASKIPISYFTREKRINRDIFGGCCANIFWTNYTERVTFALILNNFTKAQRYFTRVLRDARDKFQVCTLYFKFCKILTTKNIHIIIPSSIGATLNSDDIVSWHFHLPWNAVNQNTTKNIYPPHPAERRKAIEEDQL